MIVGEVIAQLSGFDEFLEVKAVGDGSYNPIEEIALVPATNTEPAWVRIES